MGGQGRRGGVKRVEPPADCAAFLPGYDFADSYQARAPAGMDAIEVARRALATPPRWVDALMKLRDRMVSLVGLKPAPSTGFPVLSETPEQVVLGFDDRHLDFRIVVTVACGAATITTIVRRHNIFGRLYLAAILPFHRLIAPACLAKVA